MKFLCTLYAHGDSESICLHTVHWVVKQCTYSPVFFLTEYTVQIADLANEDTPQLYVACGRGPRSTLRVLRHGLEVSEMAVSELPGNPNAVWTVKRTVQGTICLCVDILGHACMHLIHLFVPFSFLVHVL